MCGAWQPVWIGWYVGHPRQRSRRGTAGCPPGLCTIHPPLSEVSPLLSYLEPSLCFPSSTPLTFVSGHSHSGGKKKSLIKQRGTGEKTHTQTSGNGLTQIVTEFFFQLFKNWGVLNWFIGKDPDARKDWRQEEKGTTEDELVGWHHQLNGHESEQAPEVGDGQGSQACSSPWGRKESDTTVQLN